MEQAPTTQSPDALGLMAAEIFIDKLLSDPAHPVIVFAWEMCNRCQSARDRLTAANIPFHAIELDAETYRTKAFGERAHHVIEMRTGCPELPKIFISGVFFGGGAELEAVLREGRLQGMLEGANYARCGSIT